MSNMEECFKSLSMDYLNLLINGQAFSDVTFSVEGRLVHAHRCILAARSLYFRKFFCGAAGDPSSPGSLLSISSPNSHVISVNSVRYDVFFLILQFLYSGQVSVLPHKHEPRPNCGERGCWHTHCTSAVDLTLDTLAAARSLGIDQLLLFIQKQLASMVEKASIEDVMKVLMASRKHDMHQLWTTCSQLVAKSGLPPEVLAKHLPFDVVAKIEELRLKSSSFSGRSLLLGLPTHRPNFLQHLPGAAGEMEEENKIHRMRRALDSSDVELVKLMVMGEGLNLDEALALHYAVQYCSREVVKALLELGAADVNAPAGSAGKSPLHLAAEMVSPDMVAVLLDHHADPTARTVDGVTPLDVLRTLTSDYLFKGAVPGLAHLEPNKLRLCLELVQSAAMVMSRENGEADAGQGAVFPARSTEGCSGASNAMVNLNLDSRMVYLNLGGAQLSCKVDGNGNGDSPDSDSRRASMSRHESQGYCTDPSALYPHHEY